MNLVITKYALDLDTSCALIGKGILSEITNTEHTWIKLIILNKSQYRVLNEEWVRECPIAP